MLITTVIGTEKHQYGIREIWGKIEISQVRAYYVSGVGSAVIHYEGLGDNGKWYRFLKKNQPSKVKKALPVISAYPNRTELLDESRPYTRQCRYESNSVAV